jgi:hypothetical protein
MIVPFFKMNKRHVPVSGKIPKVILNYSAIMVLIICSAFTANSQNYKLSGTIVDKADNLPVIGAFVIVNDLKDTTETVASTTTVDGKFSLTGLKKKNYRLTIQSISYQKESRVIDISAPITDLGTISLIMQSKVLNEVVVVGQGTAIQKGDTTIMTADAFKVNPDANAEDLVKKMPGITVENGTVKAQGEDVTKVLVDGKPFFGDDPSAALRNLPADVIDRVQVYNKLSDQAELTGFDDGGSSRTINIITRKNSKISQFGKITAGSNFDDKYLVAGNLNIFKGPRRFTFTGMTNNVNQQNFAMQDLLGSTNSGGGRGGYRGGSFGGSSGITKNSSLGINYTDNWGKKIAVTASYFYNTAKNTVEQESNTEYLFIDDGNFSSNLSNSITNNYNHRANMRIEYNIDSLNSVIIEPRLNFQNNTANNISLYSTTGGSVNSQTYNKSLTESLGSNISNDLTWRHKFMKPGRTLSLRSSINSNDRSSKNTQIATTDSVPDNQFADNSTNNFSVNTNVSYTEPIGKYTMLQINYRNDFTRNKTDKQTYQLGDNSETLGRLDSLSNSYDNDYVTNRGGLGYLYKKNDFNLSLGLNYQQARLSGKQLFPLQQEISRTYENILPNLMMTYKFSTNTNIRVFYRTETEEPSVNQLQNVINNSNRLSLSTGNPDLQQEYGHRVMTNISYANPTSGFNAFVFITGGYTKNVIANRTIYAQRDTLDLPDYNVSLLPGGQLSYPVNLDHSMELRSFITLGYFIKPIKSNLSFVIGGGYSQSPGYIDSLLNRSNSYSLTNSLILTSNISSKLDFTLSYTSNYSLVKNSANVENIIDTKYWYQSASLKFNWIFWKGFVLQTDLVGQYNQGLSQSYNESYLVWNASLGKKFLKNQAAELKLGVYDILNQNNNITRSVTASAIRDTRTNTFQRYFLVLFTYNLRSQRGQATQQQPQQQQDERRDGLPGGMPPGGMPPGGVRPGGGPPGDFHDH